MKQRRQFMPDACFSWLEMFSSMKLELISAFPTKFILDNKFIDTLFALLFPSVFPKVFKINKNSFIAPKNKKAAGEVLTSNTAAPAHMGKAQIFSTSLL